MNVESDEEKESCLCPIFVVFSNLHQDMTLLDEDMTPYRSSMIWFTEIGT